MFKIAGALPVKTRLPFVAWTFAGVVTIFSLVTSFEFRLSITRSKQAHPRQGLSTPLSRICSKY